MKCTILQPHTYMYRHRFHEVRALHALMHAARALRENGDDIIFFCNSVIDCFVIIR